MLAFLLITHSGGMMTSSCARRKDCWGMHLGTMRCVGKAARSDIPCVSAHCTFQRHDLLVCEKP